MLGSYGRQSAWNFPEGSPHQARSGGIGLFIDAEANAGTAA